MSKYLLNGRAYKDTFSQQMYIVHGIFTLYIPCTLTLYIYIVHGKKHLMWIVRNYKGDKMKLAII